MMKIPEKQNPTGCSKNLKKISLPLKKTVKEMIEEIDKSVKGYLSITHYPNTSGWEIHSYGLYNQLSALNNRTNAKTLRESLEKAMLKLGLSIEK